jgi:diguanylate cyclase (GGDEF)-like protein
MALFDTVNIIGATIYFVYAVLLAWLCSIPRTNPGAGWWAIAIFCGFLARLSLLLTPLRDLRSTELMYIGFIALEKFFLLIGAFKFFNLNNYIRPHSLVTAIAFIWLAVTWSGDVTRLTFSIGASVFNSYCLFFLALIALQQRAAIPNRVLLFTSIISVVFGIHWLTYPFLRFTAFWEVPGFLIGTILVVLQYLTLIAAVLLLFQKRLLDAEYNALELAYHDPLTGLNNQRYMNRLFDQALLLAMRPHQMLAVIYIDLDNFKPINDTDGHLVGDEVLKIIAKRLVDNTRSTDICARMGGDEFVVIATQLESEDHAHQIAAKLLQQCCNPVDTNNKNYHLGASIGVSVYPTHGNDLTQLLKNADDAMYEVKKNGKSGYRVVKV